MIQIKSVQCEYQDLWIRIMNFQHKSSHLWIDKSTSCRAQNLRQGIVMKTSFEITVSQMGLGSFVDINIFVIKYHFIYFLHILNFC